MPMKEAETAKVDVVTHSTLSSEATIVDVKSCLNSDDTSSTDRQRQQKGSRTVIALSQTKRNTAAANHEVWSVVVRINDLF